MGNEDHDIHERAAATHNPVTIEITHHGATEELHGTAKLVHTAGKYWDTADFGKLMFRAVTGKAALGRNYSILKNVTQLNKNGQFTGQVVNKNAMVLFRHTIEEGEYGARESAKYLKYADRVGLFVGFAAEIAGEWPRIRAIAGSQIPMAEKGKRFAPIAWTAAQRALLGIVPFGVHLIYRSLETVCGALPAGSSQCVDTLRLAGSYVQVSYTAITDTGNQSKALWWVTDVVVSPRATLKPVAKNIQQSVTNAVHGMFLP